MANCLPLSMSRSSSRKCFSGEDSLSNNKNDHGGESSEKSENSSSQFHIGVPRRLVRSVSLKFRRLNMRHDVVDNEERESWNPGKCLGIYAKSVRCRVGDDVEVSGVGKEFVSRRESYGCFDLETGIERLKSRNKTMSQGRKSFERLKLKESSDVSLSSKGKVESLMLWKKSDKKVPERNSSRPNVDVLPTLPDDIVEMCLARASFATIMSARLVCRRWKILTSSSHFMQLRSKCLSQHAWLFLFGLSKDGISLGQIQALDTGMNQWHKIDADVLRGRFMFSVTSVGNSIYVIGGCSSSNNTGRMEKSLSKTQKTVFSFSPFFGTWKKITPMRTARVMPVVCVFELQNGTKAFLHRTKKRHNGNYNEEEGGNAEQVSRSSRLSKFEATYLAEGSSRVSKSSEVYNGSQKSSGRKQLWEIIQESRMSELPSLAERDDGKFKEGTLYGIIVAGGQGQWSEPLDSAEIYDPVSNKWKEIARLPSDHGVICAGTVCGGKFYAYTDSNKLATYNIEKGTWIGIEISNSPARLPDYSPKLITCGDRLFMLCVSWSERVHGNTKVTRKLLEFDISSYSWTELSRHPDAPLDWNAAFVGNGDKIYGVEMFKIFGQVLDFVTVCDVSEPEVVWKRVSKKNVAQDMDSASCATKAVAILQL